MREKSRAMVRDSCLVRSGIRIHHLRSTRPPKKGHVIVHLSCRCRGRASQELGCRGQYSSYRYLISVTHPKCRTHGEVYDLIALPSFRREKYVSGGLR